MRFPRQGWQLLLFVAAILVPSVALVVVTSRIVEQGRELTEKRRLDEQRATVDRIARELLLKLDEAARQAGAGADRQPPPVVLAAPIREGHLVLPWENDAAVRRVREQLADAGFKAQVARAEREEFAGRRQAAAEAAYREALAAATTPAQTAQARLLLARLLEKMGRVPEAAAEYRVLLRMPADAIDEDGVPFPLHAAAHLASSSPADRAAAIDAARTALESRAWLSPIACFTLSDLAGKFPANAPGAAELATAAAARIRQSEQAEMLQNDAGRLGLLDARSLPSGTWQLYGDPAWLVSSVEGRLVVAVAAKAVTDPYEARGDLRFLYGRRETGGLPVGDALRGLQVVFSPRDDAALSARDAQQRRLYLAALTLLLGANVFAAWLLWHSLRREMQLAEIRSQFVSSVSHELKTPLTAIRMYAETLQMGRSRDPVMVDEYLDTIVSECGRLSRLVDNVLLFSKIEQGKKVYRFRPVSLADAVGAAARTLAYPLSQSGFELHTSIDEAVPPVQADRDAIEQAVLNLLTNAMKYSGDSRSIDLRVARSNGDALIEVTDYGVGIAAEHREHIFEKYYRAPMRENQAIPGTGLGLALVSQIVKAHGGRVDVISAPGKGSRFTLRLPIGQEEAS